MKSPFEIRADMLTLAKDYLDKQFQVNKEFFERATIEAMKTGMEVQKALEPKMYNADEILKTAKEFYDFVQKSTKIPS